VARTAGRNPRAQCERGGQHGDAWMKDHLRKKRIGLKRRRREKNRVQKRKGKVAESRDHRSPIAGFVQRIKPLMLKAKWTGGAPRKRR